VADNSIEIANPASIMNLDLVTVTWPKAPIDDHVEPRSLDIEDGARSLPENCWKFTAVVADDWTAAARARCHRA
jgi:hypothetical protein